MATPSGPSDHADTGFPARDPGRPETVQTRSTIAPGELATVCSLYDLGAVERVFAFNRGSRLSPKAVIETDQGRFLVKRRARGRDDPYRVAFSHDLQLHLHAAGFPIPELLGTRSGNNSMVQLDGRVYEVFRFVEGVAFDRTPGPCLDAGRRLAQLHRLLQDYQPRWPAPVWTHAQLNALATQLDAIARGGLARTETRQLRTVLARAAAAIPGPRALPSQLLHADWHPGNMIFRDGRVAAVLDFDAARRGPVLLDLAGGALQFSIMRVGVDPEAWPAELDAARLDAFLRGYSAEAPAAPALAHLHALPAMMTAVLIADVVAPIAAAGNFAGRPPEGFLRMALRKSAWLLEREPQLVRLAARAAGQGPQPPPAGPANGGG